MTKKTTMWAMLCMLITAPAWGQQVPFKPGAPSNGAKSISPVHANAAGTQGAAPLKAVEAQKLFEEHFDKFTAGSPEAPDITPGAYSLSMICCYLRNNSGYNLLG